MNRQGIRVASVVVGSALLFTGVIVLASFFLAMGGWWLVPGTIIVSLLFAALFVVIAVEASE